MTYILSMFNTGQVTLPKKWRSQFNTTKFKATEEKGRLIVEPIENTPEQLRDENIEIYDEGHGIRFKKGLSGEALEYFKQALKDE